MIYESFLIPNVELNDKLAKIIFSNIDLTISFILYPILRISVSPFTYKFNFSFCNRVALLQQNILEKK